MNQKIKVGFCVAYDWYFLKQSLPPVYDSADSICIAVDRDRISWTGKPFSIDEAAFATFVHELDKDNKIMLYEDDFHQPDLSPMQNEVRQRNMMAAALGTGGWHLQLDSDEYFIDFPGFADYLRKLSFRKPVNIACPWITMFKNIDNGFLLIDCSEPEHVEFIPIATNVPIYKHGRRNEHFNYKVNFPILHQSWARSEDEVLQKIRNWGHKDDFDVDAYFSSWQGLNESNYRSFINFHPLVPATWPSLFKVTADSIPTLIAHFRQHPRLNIPKSYLRKANSVWRSRIKAILNKLG